MSFHFRPLPDDCIEYYDRSSQEIEALAVLASGVIDRDAYLALDLPLGVGKFHPGFFESHSLGDSGERKTYDATMLPYSSGDLVKPDELQRIIDATKSPAAVQKVQSLILTSQFNFDPQIFGDSSGKLKTVFDNRPTDPVATRAPFWHFDYMDPENPPENPEIIPERITSLIRCYGFRLSSSDNPENLQPEYIKDRDLMQDGQLHPLIAEALEQTRRHRELKQKHVQTNYDIRTLVNVNKDFTDAWQAIEEARVVLDKKMRDAGLIHQAEPDEILLWTNHTLHRTHPVSRPQKSVLGGLWFASTDELPFG